jgi:ribonuclease D
VSPDAGVGVSDLLHMADPPPPVVADDEALRSAAAELDAGSGPVAVDAERAGSYRYSQRAYLVQMYRRGGPVVLLDPLHIRDFSPLVEVLGQQWVMQAAHNDLDCLAELDMRPRTLFDTEIAAQLLGLERVGLASLVEARLGLRLRKGHGQADWSSRPLRRGWLVYAALDVCVLPDLRDVLDEDLAATGKRDWAEQEFAHQMRPRPAVDPSARWLRTNGAGRLRTDAQRGALRALWHHRDEVAQARDIAWHRVMRDQVMVEMALKASTSREGLAAVANIPRTVLRDAGTWLEVIARGVADPVPRPARSEGPPARSVRAWEQRDPEAAARWVDLRSRLAERAEQLNVWQQTLLAPDIVADLAWRPPEDPASRLDELGARAWQVENTVDLLG